MTELRYGVPVKVGDDWKEHTKRPVRGRDGTECVAIVCPYCGAETRTSWWTLSWYGKSCWSCGAKHMFFGLTRQATEHQAALAVKRRMAKGTTKKPRRARGSIATPAARAFAQEMGLEALL